MEYLNRAYTELFKKENETYNISLNYSGHFKDYNANVRLRGNNLTFAISKNWKDVDEEIKVGLIQELMVKILTRRRKTPKPHTHNIDLYNNFLRSLHIAAPKTEFHPLLEECFNRINDLHFNGMIDPPNLVIGAPTTRTLGSYNYQNDTITISKILEEHQELLDYVMHHEMLHKQLKFECKNGRGHHHTPEFKRREAAYPNQLQLEKQLNMHAHSWKRKSKKRVVKVSRKSFMDLRRWFKP